MNTTFADLAKISDKVYQEWYNKTVLVKSCSNEYEGEFSVEKREVDIPIYQDLSVHYTTIKEGEVKPAPIEFIAASTKRVRIDKARYSHFGQTEIGKMLNTLGDAESESRNKLTNKWAQEAEEELGKWVAFDSSINEITASSVIAAAGAYDSKETSGSEVGYVSAENILVLLDALKARVKVTKMPVADFKLYASEKLASIARDAKLFGVKAGTIDSESAFENGYVGKVDGIDLLELDIPSITKRNATTGLVEAEYAIWKAKDGIQYVIPYRNTVEYDLDKGEILLGGKGYQMVEYYDFFNVVPTRLYRVAIKYSASASLPTNS